MITYNQDKKTIGRQWKLAVLSLGLLLAVIAGFISGASAASAASTSKSSANTPVPVVSSATTFSRSSLASISDSGKARLLDGHHDPTILTAQCCNSLDVAALSGRYAAQASTFRPLEVGTEIKNGTTPPYLYPRSQAPPFKNWSVASGLLDGHHDPVLMSISHNPGTRTFQNSIDNHSVRLNNVIKPKGK
jgi:hypothetical protein